MMMRRYYDNGQLHDEKYWINEQKRYLIKEKRHNTTGPAIKSWFENGQVECEYYYLNGNKHRLNDPAVRYWYKNGLLRKEEYYLRGERHNTTGPAIKKWDENGHLNEECYIDGNFLTKEEFENRKNTCDGKVVEIDGKKYKLTAVSS